MINQNQKITIAESDFNLANYSQPNHLTDKVILQAKDNPGLFQLAIGDDHIEISVKTVDLGDQETPGTTMSARTGTGATPNNNRNSVRSSGRRGTMMMNTPFIPESPSASGVNLNSS